MQIDSLEKRRIVFCAPELHAESGRVVLPARVDFQVPGALVGMPRLAADAGLCALSPPRAGLASIGFPRCSPQITFGSEVSPEALAH